MIRKWTAFGLTLALALTTGAQQQQKKPVTLEALQGGMARMMGGFAAAPIWSPQGARFAYRKATKVLIYDLATKESKDAFDTAELGKGVEEEAPPRANPWVNRGVREQNLQWSADGKKMLALVKGDLFLWTEEGGTIQRLTSTLAVEHDPKLSPDGAMVGFRRGHELYVEDVASKKETRLTWDATPTLWNGDLDWVYPEELALGTAWWWSPDSKRIAYLQFDVSREPLYPQADQLQMVAVSEPERYPKAGTPNADVRLGVVSAAGGMTRWMDLGETRDFLIARVHWTPDSRNVVAHRLNRVQDHLEVMRADAATGVAKVLFEEKDPFWININDDFEFLSDGRMVLTSERDGFRHIYVHAADGKEKARLTKGDWEVPDVSCVDEPNKKVYFVSTEESPLERQLWVVGLDGSGKRKITQGAGTHSVSMSPKCDAFLDTYSNLETPSRGVLRKADGTEIAVWREPDTKTDQEYDILKTEIVDFKGADGTKFYGKLIKPAGFDPGKKYPAIVEVYGGPHAQSVRNSYSGLSWDQVMAHKGFVIWQMDNRGSFGRGHKFETPLYRRLGKVEVEDQKEGVKYLIGLGFVDPGRIGVNGWSYGGHMVLQCLLQAPEVFKAGIAGAPVTDWRNYDTIYTERYLGLPQENAEGYKASSPVNLAANLKGKLLMIHNIQDDNVLFANSIQMMNAFQLAGKPYESLIYPQKSHGVTGRARNHMMRQMTDFFEEALKSGPEVNRAAQTAPPGKAEARRQKTDYW
jgi:dipeptidyl-peptidase-4